MKKVKAIQLLMMLKQQKGRAKKETQMYSDTIYKLR